MRPWSESDIPDLSGRRAVVTGANSGLGLETSRALAARGAEVVLACRNVDKAEVAAELVKSTAAGPMPVPMSLDLADLESVRSFAGAFGDSFSSLDILVNNAGIMAGPPALTADGFESQIGTNHLGHFALTGLLMPYLAQKPGARVVTVSSNAARIGRVRLDDLHGERSYSPWRAYSQSKLANLYFALELDRRLRRDASPVISVAAHPGHTTTGLVVRGPVSRYPRLFKDLAAAGDRAFGQAAATGALPQLYAATAAGVRGGQYFGPALLELRGAPKEVQAPRAAHDEDVARRLWTVSEDLTGVAYL